MSGLYPRYVARLAVFTLLLFQAACARSPKHSMDNILKSFAGNWKVVSLDRSGNLSDADVLKGMSVTVEGDKFMFLETSGPDRREGDVTVQELHNEEYVFQVNPARSGDIDFIHTTGDSQGKSRPGLYELEGKTLRICLASAGNTRPAQIASGDNFTVFVLERESK